MSESLFAVKNDITTAFIDALYREVDFLMEEGTTELTLDMEEVNVIDSTGIGFIIRLQNSLKEKGGALKLCSVNEDIVKMMKIMRLDNHFTIEG